MAGLKEDDAWHGVEQHDVAPYCREGELQCPVCTAEHIALSLFAVFGHGPSLVSLYASSSAATETVTVWHHHTYHVYFTEETLKGSWRETPEREAFTARLDVNTNAME